MNQFIYLHELDSTRLSRREVLAGQDAMFYQIVNKGNCVVVTYNQLTDAPSFLYPLKWQETYQQMLQLFENGSIKVARYIDRTPGGGLRETRTAAQYVLHAVSKALGAVEQGADTFIFSALPVKRNNRPMLETLRDAIQFSDPARIEDLVAIAQDPTRRSDWDALGIADISLSDLEYILRYVRLILHLSQEPLSHISAKSIDDPISLLPDYLSAALAAEPSPSEHPSLYPHFTSACALLRRLKEEIPASKQFSRSPWLAPLLDMAEEATEEDLPTILLAEAIINLCYNYTVEENIRDISKRYGSLTDGFLPDFIQRLDAFWQESLAGLHIFNDKQSSDLGISPRELPNWALAVSTRNETARLRSLPTQPIENADALWRRRSRWGLQKKLLSSLIYLPLFLLLEWAINFLETLLTEPNAISLPTWEHLLPLLLSAACTTFFLGLISGWISRRMTIPDIADTLSNVWHSMRDLFSLRRVQNGGKSHE